MATPLDPNSHAGIYPRWKGLHNVSHSFYPPARLALLMLALSAASFAGVIHCRSRLPRRRFPSMNSRFARKWATCGLRVIGPGAMMAITGFLAPGFRRPKLACSGLPATGAGTNGYLRLERWILGAAYRLLWWNKLRLWLSAPWGSTAASGAAADSFTIPRSCMLEVDAFH